MSEPIITVENLSKCYRIGAKEQGYKTFREAVLDGFKAPIRNLKQLRGLTKFYSRQSIGAGHKNASDVIWALKDVSFEVERGEVLGVIGRNGAGKTTLLKILSRITEPNSGDVKLYGRISSLLEVGTGFHPELTGRENIYLNGSILGMSKPEIDRKFDEIVDFSEIAKFLDTPVKRYSSGMYVRLAFAVAAHLEPEIFIVDEVLAVGDAQFQKKCLGKMEEVGKKGRTVLFVSHNMNAIEDLCTKVLLLEEGCLKQFSRDVRSVTKTYLFGTTDDLQQREWINIGAQLQNPWFRPLRFGIADSHGNIHRLPVRNDAEIWVKIEGEIDDIDPSLTVGYALYSERGDLLYWSYHTDCPEEKWPKLGKGRCVLKSKIPTRMLNEGTYKIELIGGLHFRQWLFEPGINAPSIHLTIQGGLSDSPLWMVKRPGLLAPVITWILEE